MLASIHQEWGCTNGRVNRVVVGKLSDGEPILPIILLVIDEDSEVLLNILVNLFGLAISLGVIGSGRVLLDT